MQNFVSGLVDVNGRPLSMKTYAGVPNKSDETKTPQVGRKHGSTAADETNIARFLPKMNTIAQFDLDSLTLDDYEMMRTHPQVNASLSVLTFLQHQAPWDIECEDEKIRTAVHDEIEKVWTTLNRSFSQANWAGYSPGVIEWENDVENRSVVLNKIIDLRPQECTVNWKQVVGWAPPEYKVKPKYNIYDGIKQIGTPWHIPVQNTLWYPMLMENGDYYGRKLLKAAFTPWYFSIMIHLYANRYYERFGEPIPVGRAPFDELEPLTLPNPGGEPFKIMPHQYMLQKMMDLRNRSAIVLPSEGQQDSSGKFRFDYELDFMESQMRGAEFDRYIHLLDEEITLSLFTPVLLLRTADVGSYNLGEAHEQTYYSILNALNSDRKLYIDKYLIRPFVRLNFGDKAAKAGIKFRPLGAQDKDTIKTIIQSLSNAGRIMPDLDELSQIAGISLKEVEQIVEPTTTAPDEATKKKVTEGGKEVAKKAAAQTQNSMQPTSDAAYWKSDAVFTRILDRVKPQVDKTFSGGLAPNKINFGYGKQVIDAFTSDGVLQPGRAATVFYGSLDTWVDIVAESEMFATADEYMAGLKDYMQAISPARSVDVDSLTAA